MDEEDSSSSIRWGSRGVEDDAADAAVAATGAVAFFLLFDALVEAVAPAGAADTTDID